MDEIVDVCHSRIRLRPLGDCIYPEKKVQSLEMQVMVCQAYRIRRKITWRQHWHWDASGTSFAGGEVTSISGKQAAWSEWQQ